MNVRASFITILIILTIAAYWNCLPEHLFHDDNSIIVESSDGTLLSARIASDEQWRFPDSDTVPEKFTSCILTYEDKYFFSHPGFNPFSLIRALRDNIRNGKIVSGGSTISMQLMRLSRKNRARTITEKLIEIILSTRLEIRSTKSEILAMYASHAPFGGNVVGLEAAAWRYYGRSPENLSWAENATLAVLPNSPGLIHPGRNREALGIKRDALLLQLLQREIIDSTTYELSLLESLPQQPLSLPQQANHLMNYLANSNPGKRIRTTLDIHLQNSVNDILSRHKNILHSNEIYNAAVLIVEVETGAVKAYVGNIPVDNPLENNAYVDVIRAPRSTGSIMKPFLYAVMLRDGVIMPKSLVADIPTVISGYSPKNFNLAYDGAVHASEALRRSLNIPSVRMLQEFGVAKFHNFLLSSGITTMTNEPGHYGLSLILGGGEASLWELAGVYSSMSRTLLHYYNNYGQYEPGDLHMPHIIVRADDNIHDTVLYNDTEWLTAASIWTTYTSLLEVNRPYGETGWEYFNTNSPLAWKTGTSFGFRDAWAIGTSPEYVVAVWAGNADGEGRPGLTGIQTAAPIMFDVFDLLPKAGWFDEPTDEMIPAVICRASGHRASLICNARDTIMVPLSCMKTLPCPYHIPLILSSDLKHRVSKTCYDGVIVDTSWFVLPPVQEYYFRKKNPYYKDVPPPGEGCTSDGDEVIMGFIYPDRPSKLYIPKEMDGTEGEIVFRIAHRNMGVALFWHLDEEYIGKTQGMHQMGLAPVNGNHRLVIVDENGLSVSMNFEIMRSGSTP